MEQVFLAMSAKLAVSIIADDAPRALEQARSLPHGVSLIEYRLDAMSTIDIQRLASQTPLSAIFTCRSRNQGGAFEGAEEERRDILKRALATQHFVDIEMDALPDLTSIIEHPARVIGSWHDFDGMLEDWGSLGARIHGLGVGVVKLVGMAASEEDVLRPIVWLASWPHPGIAIAMGPAGVASRLLAPRFPNAFLTFASLDQATAPGQIPVRDMTARYGFSHIADASPLLILLTPDPVPWERVERYRQAMSRHFSRGRPWLLPIPARTFPPGMAISLKLARVSGIIRMPEVTTSSELTAFGFESQAFAWDTTLKKTQHFFDYPDPDSVMAFLSQGS